LKWLKHTPKAIKTMSLIVAGLLMIGVAIEAFQDDELDANAVLVLVGIVGGIGYCVTLFTLRVAILPFQGFFRTLRFGYRAAVVASRTSAAEKAGLAALADLDTWEEAKRPPAGVMAELDWGEVVEAWRADMASTFIYPSIAIICAWFGAIVASRTAGGGWFVGAALFSFWVFRRWLKKVNQDDQLAQAMVAYLQPRLEAACTEASDAVLEHASVTDWRTPYGPLRAQWTGRRFTIEVVVPKLTAAVVPSRGRATRPRTTTWTSVTRSSTTGASSPPTNTNMPSGFS